MENWDDYRIFLAVARATSVRKAAGVLNLSHSTVLRRITSLEETLGVRLFDRMPSGYFTTDSGDDLFSYVENIEEQAISAKRRLIGRDTQLNGKICVSMPGVFATHLLMPDLAAFRRAHPKILLEIVSTYSDSDLRRREADVAIRVSNEPSEDLFGRRLLDIARATFISKTHLKEITRNDSSQPLNWIGWSNSLPPLTWLEKNDFPEIQIGSIANDPHATLEAVKAGMGLAILPCFVGDAEQSLCRFQPGTIHLYKSLWVLTHEDLRNVARIRVFISFIAKAILKHSALISGNMPKTD